MPTKYIAQENQSDTNVSPGTYEFTKQLLLTPNGFAWLGLTIPAYTSKRCAWLTPSNEPGVLSPVTGLTYTIKLLIGEITVISDPSNINLEIRLRRTNSAGVIQLTTPTFPSIELITKNSIISKPTIWPTDTWNATDRLCLDLYFTNNESSSTTIYLGVNSG